MTITTAPERPLSAPHRLQVSFHPEADADLDEIGPVEVIDLSELDRVGTMMPYRGEPSWRRHYGFMTRRDAVALARSLDADFDES